MNKLLVANRGEIARRVFRTAAAMDIATVAVYSDADAGAPHVREAGEAVRLPGSAPVDTYLNVDAVLAAARKTGADAIHPGYGFLSENADFARASAAAGLTFVGPSPEAIAAMGSKIAAKDLMASVGVPVLTDEGWPKLVKASAGGGGRGMRIVRTESELQVALAAAAHEAASAFGDGTVFIERFVEDPRHIEVQVFGDVHGNVVHLFERECSIQRRYQKVIEEAPSPAVDDRLRKVLGEAAVSAAKALGYIGAGTVEFVVDQEGDFYFLEVNTRLQVEHPVTELITGLDLVELQLLVAGGEPLPEAALSPTISGHAVEARLYAEDAAAGFVPCAGTIHRFRVPALSGIRVDSGYEDGSVVSTHYDAMLGKVIAHADTRESAVARLAAALAATQVHGPPTNRDLLVRVLRHSEFLAGRIDTGFLTRNDCTAPLADEDTRRVHAVAAAVGGQAERRRGETLPSGWRNVPTALQRAMYAEADVGYRIIGGDGLIVELDGEPVEVSVSSATAEHVDLTVAGVRRSVHLHRVGSITYVDDASGATVLHEVDCFPRPGDAMAAGSLLAPLPGSVVLVLAEAGQRVVSGETLIVLEAMKMEHRVTSPADGTVTELRVGIGDQVEPGQVLAVVEDREIAR